MSSRHSLAGQAADLAAALRSGGLPDDPAALIDLIGELETLKSAACAAQGEAAVAYDAARRSAESAPHRGQTLLGLGKILHHEMPRTRARLADGRLSEFRAILLVRETACLTAEQRLFVAEELCADPAALDGIGTRELVARAKRAAYEIDPAAVVRRARNAESDRNVTVRPAPDTMTYLTGLLPVAQGVAVHAVEIRTPTGHRYRSQAPPPVGWREPRWVNDRPGVYTLVA